MHVSAFEPFLIALKIYAVHELEQKNLFDIKLAENYVIMKIHLNVSLYNFAFLKKLFGIKIELSMYLRKEQFIRL